MTHSLRSSLARPRTVTTLLVAAGLVNVWQFGAIEGRMTAGYAALVEQPSTELVESIAVQSRTPREGYELYLLLSRVAPGATLRAAPGLGLRPERAEGLGRVFLQRSPQPPVDPGLVEELAPHVVARGTSHAGPYVIAVGSDPVTDLVAVRLDEVLYVLDEELLGNDAG